MDLLFTTFSGAVLATIAFGVTSSRSKREWARLAALDQQQQENFSSSSNPIDWHEAARHLASLSLRLGRAGFLTQLEQRRVRFLSWIVIATCSAAGLVTGYHLRGISTAAIGLVLGAYGGAVVWMGFLQYRRQEHARLVAFHMPLTLESLILLVESGLGVLAAIERVVSTSKLSKGKNPVIRYLNLAYELAAHGMPLGTALATVAEATDERVIRHVFLHLDLSGTEGGELIPALRNLGKHAHTEWRLSVENRVRRLENMVVFPVFVSVIGLMCLTAAVPLVPVLKLKTTLQQKAAVSQASTAAFGIGNLTK